MAATESILVQRWHQGKFATTAKAESGLYNYKGGYPALPSSEKFKLQTPPKRDRTNFLQPALPQTV
jgi:hypothetical protein